MLHDNWFVGSNLCHVMTSLVAQAAETMTAISEITTGASFHASLKFLLLLKQTKRQNEREREEVFPHFGAILKSSIYV